MAACVGCIRLLGAQCSYGVRSTVLRARSRGAAPVGRVKAIVSLGRSTGADVRLYNAFWLGSQFGAAFSEPLAFLALIWNPLPRALLLSKHPPNEQWRRYGPQNPNYKHLAGAALPLLV